MVFNCLAMRYSLFLWKFSLWLVSSVWVSISNSLVSILSFSSIVHVSGFMDRNTLDTDSVGFSFVNKFLQVMDPTE